MFIRQIGFGILAALAIAVTVGLQPEVPEPIDTARFDRQVLQALSDFEANELMTSGAPQQQVVNGWVNRDLLSIISRQLSASMELPTTPALDPRLAYLLLLLVLTAVWHGSTARLAAAATVVPNLQPSDPVPPPPGVAPPDADQPPVRSVEHDHLDSNDPVASSDAAASVAATHSTNLTGNP